MWSAFEERHSLFCAISPFLSFRTFRDLKKNWHIKEKIDGLSLKKQTAVLKKTAGHYIKGGGYINGGGQGA